MSVCTETGKEETSNAQHSSPVTQIALRCRHPHRQSQLPDHDRARQLWQTEKSNAGPRHDESDGREETLLGSSTSSEWGLFNAVLERRRKEQRQEGGASTGSGTDDEVTPAKTDLRRKEASESEQEVAEEIGLYSLEGSEDRGGWDADTEVARRLASEERGYGQASRRAMDAGEVALGDGAVHIPTFAEVVDALKVNPWKAPAAFRPLVTLCGHQHSPFDSVIPFERLQVCLELMYRGVYEPIGVYSWRNVWSVSYLCALRSSKAEPITTPIC